VKLSFQTQVLPLQILSNNQSQTLDQALGKFTARSA
jgi:hypothetical protein